jgi:glyoxylase-like metal-dependent hydrolase (beta-lactamase superfamily II)
MRRLVPALTCFVAFAGAASAQDFDQIQITTTPVRGPISMLQGSGGNIAVLAGDDGTLIVDDQFAPLTGKITAAIARLTPRPVSFVVNSHWHYDHSDGNTNFGRAGAIIVAHENSRTRMMSDQIVSLSNRLQEAYDEDGLPKITFFQSMRFHYNGQMIDLVHLPPAHTDGDTFVYFRDANVIHTGDVFVRYGLPFIDNPNGGSINGMIDGTWLMAGLIDDETIIIPGHGQLSNRNDLLEYRAMLVTLRDRLRGMMDAGHSADRIVAANPTAGYAEPGPGTERWIRAAIVDLSR